MTKPLVYLAGPVTGLWRVDAADWRQEADAGLLVHNIHTIDPLRMLPPSIGPRDVLADDMEGACSASDPSAVLARCHWDVQRCDVVLVNMNGATTVSIGTTMEIAWAVAYNKPIVIVDEPNGPHDHCMIRSSTPYFFASLDDAIDVIYRLLS